ncbi:RCC1/BLIP-II, partial [Russula emetica]
IADIPVEVFLDNLLPLAELRDVLSLASTNKLFAAVCADETFWRRRCQADFNFTSQETARQSGWKNLYRGLRHPRIFVWGQRANGRLGLKDIPHNIRGVPYPIEVKIPGSRIVSLVAGGMSFHAIDTEGSMYVWGTLNGESPALISEGFAVKYKPASEPHRLLMPDPIRTVSCGRLHTMALDSKNQIWTFVTWGRPFRLDSPMLGCTSPETTPMQAECGWSFSSILTQSGDVLVFWPSSGEIGRIYDEENAAMDDGGDCNAYGTEDHHIPCVTWSLRADPLLIPPIPQLPDLESTGVSQEERSEATTLIKIAAFDNHLIGLTNKGHVLKFGDLSNEDSFNRTTRWQYLKNFSELSELSAHPTFRDENIGLQAPTSLRITHITAHFETFVAYSTASSSIILMGDVHSDEESQPKIIPELQNRSVISIVLGDYHYGALTADGQLLTWGQYSHGALGLGVPTELPLGTPGGYSAESQLIQSRRSQWGPLEPPRVASPSPVHFNHGPNPGGRRFCFAATAAGWHTGALVVCLEPEKEVYDDSTSTNDEPSIPRFGQFGRDEAPSGSRNEPSAPSDAGLFGFAGRIFRIGYAGTWEGCTGDV